MTIIAYTPDTSRQLTQAAKRATGTAEPIEPDVLP